MHNDDMRFSELPKVEFDIYRLVFVAFLIRNDDYLLFHEHLQAADCDNLIRQSQIVAFVWRLDWINDHALVSAVISDSPTMSIPLHDDDYQYRWNMAIEEVANYDDPAHIVVTYFVHIQLISQQAPMLQRSHPITPLRTAA